MERQNLNNCVHFIRQTFNENIELRKEVEKLKKRNEDLELENEKRKLPIYYTKKEVAGILSVHRNTLRNYVDEGRIKTDKVNKRIMISEKSLLEYLGKKIGE